MVWCKIEKYRREKLKKVLIIIALIALSILLFRAFGIKIIYPQKYTELVDKYSAENNLDKMLVYAIIKAESNFEPNITSQSGAMGLMQVMEETAREIADELGYVYEEKENLYEPEVNIMIGTRYFANLLKAYEGNTNLALAAYNAGIGNVNKWIKEGIIKSDGSDIENIPFKETNNYVRKILRDYKIYKEIY